MISLFQFFFIMTVPFVLVFGAIFSLFAIGALFDSLENPGDLRIRIEGLFRRPLTLPRVPGVEHYYKPYWIGR